MTDLALGPFTAGIDNITDDTQHGGMTQTGWRVATLREAMNVDISRDGVISTRRGRVLRLAGTGLHSPWNDGATGYIMNGSLLCRVESGWTLTTLLDLGSAGPVSFCAAPTGIYFASPAGLGIIWDGAARWLTVPDGSTPGPQPWAAGGLPAGRYGVAIAFTDARGTEGGLSDIHWINVADGGGVRFTATDWPTGCTAQVYMTQQNGDVLYRRGTIPRGIGAFIQGNQAPGRVAETQHLRQMPTGHTVRWWRGRLVVASGRALYISEPMRPHLYSPRFGWVQLPNRVTLLECVEGGIWTADAWGPRFLAGTDPAQLDMQRFSAPAPIERCSALVPAELLPPETAGTSPAAVWLSTQGWTIGTSTGQLIAPNARSLTIPTADRGCVVVHNRRLTALLQ